MDDSNNLTMRGGMGMINGLAKAGAKAGTIGRMRLGATPSQRTIPRLCRRGMETQNSLMTVSLMYSCTHCFLVPRARKHLRVAGDLDRFAIDGGRERFLEYLKTKMGIRRPTGRGSGIQEVHLRNQTCEG